jgi:hypothetical protein
MLEVNGKRRTTSTHAEKVDVDASVRRFKLTNFGPTDRSVVTMHMSYGAESEGTETKVGALQPEEAACTARAAVLEVVRQPRNQRSVPGALAPEKVAVGECVRSAATCIGRWRGFTAPVGRCRRFHGAIGRRGFSGGCFSGFGGARLGASVRGRSFAAAF